MRIAIVFPGQGTQSPGMGTPWKGHRCWDTVEAAIDANSISLTHLLCEATAAELSSTRLAQLSVLCNSLIAWGAISEALEDSSHEIVGFAGHSLGQVTALIAAGSISLNQGIGFAEVRATATQHEASRHPGRMAAFVGASLEQAEAACDSAGDVWVANDNAPGQIVIAGTPEGVTAAIERGKELGIRKALPLAVDGAFHTPLMQGAVATLRQSLESTELKDTHHCVVSNADATQYRDGSGWRDRLAVHPTQRVRWRSSMEALIREQHADAMLEVGHGSMVAGVAKRTVPGIAVLGISSPETATSALTMLDTLATQSNRGTP